MIEKMPRLKDKVRHQLESLDKQFATQEGLKGNEEAEKTRLRLKLNKKTQ